MLSCGKQSNILLAEANAGNFVTKILWLQDQRTELESFSHPAACNPVTHKCHQVMKCILLVWGRIVASAWIHMKIDVKGILWNFLLLISWVERKIT